MGHSWPFWSLHIYTRFCYLWKKICLFFHRERSTGWAELTFSGTFNTGLSQLNQLLSGNVLVVQIRRWRLNTIRSYNKHESVIILESLDYRGFHTELSLLPSALYPHDNIHEITHSLHGINTWTCPIHTQCGYIGYISHDNIHEINTWKCPIQTQCGYIWYIPHDNIHEINTWTCPIQTQCGYIGYISHDNIHGINTWTCPIQTQCGYIGYIPHDNIHGINTWTCPIQTQCGYIGYISHDNIHEINTWKCPIQTQCG